MQRRKFNREFKVEAVKLVCERGVSVARAAPDERHAHLVAHLPDDLAHPEPHFALEHFEPVLGRPDEMAAMMKSRVTTGGIAPGYLPSPRLKPVSD